MTTMVGLYVEFKAKTDSVDKAFSKMQSESTKVAANQNKISNAIGKSISSVAGLAASFIKLGATMGAIALGGAAALFAVINNIAESIDKVTDSARGLGIGAVELQGLAFAAKQSGVEFSSLETAISKMNLKLASVFSGKTKLSGLDVSGLEGLKTDEQFVSIVKALEGIQDKSQQASAAFEIFGKSYKEVLKIARDKSIIELTSDFDKLGLAISDSQRAAVDAFGDSQNRLSAIWQGFTQKVVAYAAEPFEKMVTWISDTITQMGGIDKAAQEFAKAIVSGVQFAVNAIQGLINVVDSLSIGLTRSLLLIKEIAQNAPDPFAVTKAIGEKYGLLEQGGAADRQLNRSEEIKQLQKQLNTQVNAQANRAEFFSPLQNILESSKNNIGVLESFIPPIKSATDNAQAFANSLALGTKKMDDAISKMISDAGASKLQKLIGNDGTDKAPAIEQQSVEQWDTRLKNIYMKALAGDTFATTLGPKTTASQDLQKLQQSITEGTNAGNAGSLTDYIGAVAELKKFVDKMESTKTNKLDITVKTDKGFNLEIAQSTEMQQVMNKKINEVAQTAARMGAK